MKIKVFSRNTTKRLLERKEAEVEYKNTIFISINTFSKDYATEGDKDGSEPTPVPEKFLDKTLVLHFDDATNSSVSRIGCSLKLFNKEMAMSICKFIENKLNEFPETDTIWVHCTAGISRSGAVGVVLNDYFNKFLENNSEDFYEFQHNGHERMLDPNPLVSRILKSTLGMSYQDVDQDNS